MPFFERVEKPVSGSHFRLIEEIESLKAALKLAERKRDNWEASRKEPIFTLAIYLHEVFRPAVEDGWWYEVKDELHDWNGHQHKFWLDRATQVMQGFGDKLTELEIASLIRTARGKGS